MTCSCLVLPSEPSFLNSCCQFPYMQICYDVVNCFVIWDARAWREDRRCCQAYLFYYHVDSLMVFKNFSESYGSWFFVNYRWCLMTSTFWQKCALLQKNQLCCKNKLKILTNSKSRKHNGKCLAFHR